MTRSILDAPAGEGLAELLDGMGSATPAPVFYMDPSGITHALNKLARELPEDDAASEAFMSPVGERGQLGHVVGYVGKGGPEAAPLVSALVALTAQVVARRLEGRDAEGSVAHSPEAIVEAACETIGRLSDEEAVAGALVEAAMAATGARGAAVFVRTGETSAFEPVAHRGLQGARLRRIRPGRGLLGEALGATRPTCASSAWRLPGTWRAMSETSGCGLEPWLQFPLALLPIGTGSQGAGLLVLTGLPDASDSALRAAELLGRACDRAAASLLGARLLRQVRRDERVQREIEIARQIQMSLLPSASLSHPGLELAGQCRPAAQVGGDYYGFRVLPDGKLAALVFDVAGHGIGAAFCMTLVRSALHAELARCSDPATVLERANALAWEDLAESGLYATAFLARIDREQGVVEMASAGAARPILWSSRERRFIDRGEGGLPLALRADGTHENSVAPFGARDLLVLYTDGIVEAENEKGERLGRSRMLAWVRRHRRRNARSLMRLLWRDVEAFVGAGALRDDATLVVMRGVPLEGDPEPVRRDAVLVGAARRDLTRR